MSLIFVLFLLSSIMIFFYSVKLHATWREVCDLILDCAEYVSFVLHIVTYKYIVFYELESY